MELVLVKRLRNLLPADEPSAEAVRRLAEGEVIRATVRRPRNPQFHRKFFALLQLVRDSTDAWPTVEALLVALKFEMGHVDRFRLSTGDEVQVPRSISFGSMDDHEFTSFYERALITLADMAGGIESDHLREAVLEQLGGP